MPAIKSSGTQIFKPFLAFETLLKPTNCGHLGYTNFHCGHFGRSWSPNGIHITRLPSVLWIQPKWILAQGQTVSRASKVS